MITPTSSTRILHVSPTGSELASGTADAPFRSIQHAAEQARPGDTVRIHAGIYRERVDPPRGGDSPESPITFEAAGDGEAVICGSEAITDWQPEAGGVWQTEVPCTLFGDHNPFAIRIQGDWFNPENRDHHTAEVFLDGEGLIEAATPHGLDPMTWFAEVTETHTRIRAHFGDQDPNRHLVEVSVRPVVFYPSQPGIDYITLRGLTLRHAASNWAPPTAEQPALIGTHWSKGWVIEDNRISHSRCVGVSLGKYGDEFDNSSKDTAEGYVGTIQRALENGWDFDHIGGHSVRRNHISHCEQAGIVGSLGAIGSRICDNHVHHIHVHRHFSGAEQAGIKLHAAIDTLVESNHVHHTERGLWMDWMAQGTRLARNVCHHNRAEDLFLEVNHGPCLVDHNLFLSAVSVRNWSEGTAFVHNLFGGRILPVAIWNRETPTHPPHRTEIAEILPIRGGADLYLNNLALHPHAEAAMDARDRRVHGTPDPALPVYPSRVEGNRTLPADSLRLVRDGNDWRMEPAPGLLAELPAVSAVTADELDAPECVGLPFETPDGKPVRFTHDLTGTAWTDETRIAGPWARNTYPALPL